MNCVGKVGKISIYLDDQQAIMLCFKDEISVDSPRIGRVKDCRFWTGTEFDEDGWVRARECSHQFAAAHTVVKNSSGEKPPSFARKQQNLTYFASLLQRNALRNK